MRQNPHLAYEAAIELTQELLAPIPNDGVIEVDDIAAFAVTNENADVGAANDELQRQSALDETSEIELTPDEIEAMLEAR
jgi:hypothetical protein